VLVVDDEQGMREMLSVLLSRAGYRVDAVSSGRQALKHIEVNTPYDVVITDLVMPGADGMEVLAAVKKHQSDSQVIVITAHGSTENAVEAMKGGAYDYVMKPFKVDEFRLVVERALEKYRLLRENLDLRREVTGRFEVERIVGSSTGMRKVVELCRRMGNTRTNVLITGESGTGKELVARAIHHLGSRSTCPFVSVNCGALPESLMESELFGHERGAFTGAIRKSDGLFREAEGGTLFLDEIGEIPLQVQVKLLRAIQERTVRPVGSMTEVPVDVRIVAASNLDLEKEVGEGRFRPDLYYRLNVVRIDIPPLHDRREDIPALIDYFLARYSREAGRKIKGMSREALQILLDYHYPGNVRELENVIERAVALGANEVLGLDTLPPNVFQEMAAPVRPGVQFGDQFNLDRVLDSVERQYILEALEQSGGVRTKAAEVLGITFRSLRYRLRKLGLDGGTFDE
jgi:two-component system response regulator PilR (NtrC family)